MRALLDAVSLAIALLWLVPLLWMISTAFKPNPEIFRLPLHWIPEQPTLEQFWSSLRVAPFGRYYANSLFVGGLSTLLTLLFASMAGYAFARLPFRGRAALLGGMLSSTMIPFQVLLIPFFILMTALKLVNTPYGLVLAYVALYLPFAVFMFRAYFLSLPREIEESARIDGCSWFGVYWRIALPLARPTIAAVGIYTFVEAWNEFFVALVLTNRTATRTLPVGLALLRNDVNGISWGQVMAGSVMACVPAIIVFLLLQRQMIAGLSRGAVKG
ncbi:MAG: carbohydrate ABC transporter permease [Proteobacteria bacterium]|nr:carbohydrate ABC transporter permease [Pseudomonadota bacterium]